MESRVKNIEGIHALYRNPKITKQSYFRWVLQYDSQAWEGVPIDKFLEAFYAELENGIQCSRPYVQLNDSPMYRPHSKKTHMLSKEYWKAVDPRRFSLPVSKKAVEEEAFCFYQAILLNDKQSCDNIVDAMMKIRENIGELVEYSRKM
jgi:L-glutamine:2-deoxy-scyllo-inosose/3-amino-2,3-dideoxy-scyllo-inosose aminotransferase